METDKVGDAIVDHCPKSELSLDLSHCVAAYEMAVSSGDKDNLCYDCPSGHVGSEHLKKVEAGMR